MGTSDVFGNKKSIVMLVDLLEGVYKYQLFIIRYTKIIEVANAFCAGSNCGRDCYSQYH